MIGKDAKATSCGTPGMSRYEVQILKPFQLIASSFVEIQSLLLVKSSFLPLKLFVQFEDRLAAAESRYM